MKRLLIGIALATMAPSALASDLFCEGTIYLAGQEVPVTRVFTLNQQQLQASVQTNAGTASGTIKANPELYLGELTTPNGSRYWFNLNRYTGSLVVMPMLADNQYGPADFNGTCRQAERKF